MSQQLAVNPANEPLTVMIPNYGKVRVEPLSEAIIRVFTTTIRTPSVTHSSPLLGGLVIDGLLYHINTYMTQHDDGHWYIQAGNIDIPRATPKQRKLMTEAITKAITEFMENNPDIMEIHKLRAWERDREELQQRLVRLESNRQSHLRNVAQDEASIAQLQITLQEHLDKRPDMITHTPTSAVIEGDFVAQN